MVCFGSEHRELPEKILFVRMHRFTLRGIVGTGDGGGAEENESSFVLCKGIRCHISTGMPLHLTKIVISQKYSQVSRSHGWSAILQEAKAKREAEMTSAMEESIRLVREQRAAEAAVCRFSSEAYFSMMNVCAVSDRLGLIVAR